MDQEFRCHYNRGKESGGSIEKSDTRLFAYVRDVTEIPGDEIVYLVKRGDRHVDGVRHIFSMEDAPLDISLGEYSDLLRQLKLLKGFYEIQTSGAIGLGNAF